MVLAGSAGGKLAVLIARSRAAARGEGLVRSRGAEPDEYVDDDRRRWPSATPPSRACSARSARSTAPVRLERARAGGRAPARALAAGDVLDVHRLLKRDAIAQRLSERLAPRDRPLRAAETPPRVSAAFSWPAAGASPCASRRAASSRSSSSAADCRTSPGSSATRSSCGCSSRCSSRLRQPLAESGRRSGRLVVTAADYTIQSLYHGLLAVRASRVLGEHHA